MIYVFIKKNIIYWLLVSNKYINKYNFLFYYIRNMYNNLNSSIAKEHSKDNNTQQAKELLPWFSKKTIITWFTTFLEEEGEGIGYDQNKIKKIKNRVNSNYGKKDSVDEIQHIIKDITSLFLDDIFTAKIKTFIENNDDKINNFGRDFFYKNGIFSNEHLKNTLLAKIKRNNLSYTAINNLSKSEILDVLQINNRFKDKDNRNQRIIDVTWRGKNKIYTLQGDRKAKMINDKLVIQETQEDQMKAKEEVSTERKEETGTIQEERVKENDTYIKSKSGKIYKKAKNTKQTSLKKNGIYILDEYEHERAMPILEDGTILDRCTGNDGETYEIIDYISANENTAHLYIVKIRNKEWEEENLRLLPTKERTYSIQKNIFIKKSPRANWINNNQIMKFIYRLLKKEVKNSTIHRVKEFWWDGERGIFYYELYNWEKINMDDTTPVL